MPDARKSRNALLCWRIHTDAKAVKSQSVVAAFHMIALQAPHGQGQFAMGAGVLQGHRHTLAVSVQDNRLRQQGQGFQFAGQVTRQTSHVPSVEHKITQDIYLLF